IILLPRGSSEQLWTWGKVREEKRIKEQWLKQQSHRGSTMQISYRRSCSSTRNRIH
ncbi:hypothetical protein FRC08_008690, partial [Ceratobasidium sp. 394]